jgi:hypothetical protein
VEQAWDQTVECLVEPADQVDHCAAYSGHAERVVASGLSVELAEASSADLG